MHMSACLTVLAEDVDQLTCFRESLAAIPCIRVAEQRQSGGADLAWALAARPVVQVLHLDMCQAPMPARGDTQRLSGRELDVLRLMARGCSYEAIGARLGVTSHTVASHIKSTYRKLAVHSAAAAVMRAVEMRLIGA
jgi:DNA-binding NarL/FixJ family response regulator